MDYMANKMDEQIEASKYHHEQAVMEVKKHLTKDDWEKHSQQIFQLNCEELVCLKDIYITVGCIIKSIQILVEVIKLSNNRPESKTNITSQVLQILKVDIVRKSIDEIQIVMPRLIDPKIDVRKKRKRHGRRKYHIPQNQRLPKR